MQSHINLTGPKYSQSVQFLANVMCVMISYLIKDQLSTNYCKYNVVV